MKKCIKCGEEKELTEFYKQPGNSDGRAGKCKECHKNDVKVNYRKNIKQFKLYDLERNIKRRDYIRQKNEEYQKKNPEKVAAAKKRWADKNKEKRKASSAISNGIRDGKIKKKPCEICKSEKAEAHHDDYSKPLEVKWLCKRCHEDRHIEQRRQKILDMN